MSRAPTLLPLVVAVVLLTACRSPRKAIEWDCLKASKVLAAAQVRAAQLCPSALVNDSVRTTADTLAGTLQPADTLNVDSLLADCAQLAEAYAAERDIYQHVLANYTRDTVRVNVRDLPPQMRRAVEQVRTTTCRFEAFRLENDDVTVLVSPGMREPLVTIIGKARTLACPPCVAKPCNPVPMVGVGTGWRTAAICLGTIIVLMLVVFYLAMQHSLRKVLGLALVIGAAGAQAQQDSTAHYQDMHYNGHIYTSLVPVGNLVASGYNIEYGEKAKRASLLLALGGLASFAVFRSVDQDKTSAAPWAIGGLMLGASVGINLHGSKNIVSGARFLQMGYSPLEFYDMVPDSIGDVARSRLRMKDYMGQQRIHVPARFR